MALLLAVPTSSLSAASVATSRRQKLLGGAGQRPNLLDLAAQATFPVATFLCENVAAHGMPAEELASRRALKALCRPFVGLLFLVQDALSYFGLKNKLNRPGGVFWAPVPGAVASAGKPLPRPRLFYLPPAAAGSSFFAVFFVGPKTRQTRFPANSGSPSQIARSAKSSVKRRNKLCASSGRVISRPRI